MNPVKVKRSYLQKFTDLPNIGPAMAVSLQLIGIDTPEQLTGKDPFDLYQRLCTKTGVRQDPCVLDVFISITRYMNGDEPKPWWYYTEERKSRYGEV